MAPENRPSQREISIPTSPFQALCCFWGVFSIFLGRQGRFCAPPIVEMLPPPNDVFPKPLQATWEPWFRDLFCLEERNFVVLVDRLIQFWHCFLAPENNIGLLDAMNLWITNKLKACESYDPSKTTCTHLSGLWFGKQLLWWNFS